MLLETKPKYYKYNLQKIREFYIVMHLKKENSFLINIYDKSNSQSSLTLKDTH